MKTNTEAEAYKCLDNNFISVQIESSLPVWTIPSNQTLSFSSPTKIRTAFLCPLSFCTRQKQIPRQNRCYFHFCIVFVSVSYSGLSFVLHLCQSTGRRERGEREKRERERERERERKRERERQREKRDVWTSRRVHSRAKRTSVKACGMLTSKLCSVVIV